MCIRCAVKEKMSFINYIKTCLKMPKGDSKVVNLRTDNTMANRKRQKDRQHNGQQKKTEGQTTQWPTEKGHKNKTLQRKLKIKQHGLPLKPGLTRGQHGLPLKPGLTRGFRFILLYGF